MTDENGKTRAAACSGGLLSVANGEVRVIATTFEWEDEIDLERAIRAQQAAEKRLQEMQEDDAQYEIAEAKLKRALIRQQVKG